MKAILTFLVIAVLTEGASWKDQLQEASRLKEQGRSADAERVYASLMAEAKQSDLSAPSAGNDLTNLGAQFYSRVRFAEAETLFRLALEAWKRSGNERSKGRAIALGNLGTLLSSTGRYREAEPVLTESLLELEAVAGPESMEAGRAMNNLAILYRSEGDLPKAEIWALRAKGILVGEPGRANNRQILASIYVDQRRFAEAEAVLSDASEGAGSWLAPSVYNSMAAAAIAEGNLDQADRLVQRALEQARLALPPGHPVVAAILNNLAQVRRFQERYLEAETYYRRAIEILEGAYGPSHPDIAKSLLNLAGFCHDRGREASAESLYNRAAGIFEQAFGKDHQGALVARNELAEVLRAERRYAESEKLGRATLAALETKFAPQDERVVRALSNYARLLAETKRPAEAAQVLSRIRPLPQGFR